MLRLPIIASLLLLAGGARPAGAGGDLVLPGAIDAVVAAGDRIAVVRGDEVRVLLDDGRPLLRLPPTPRREAAPRAGRSRHASRGRQEDDVLDLYGLPEEARDSPEVEDLVEEELGPSERRRSAPAPALDRGEPPLVAAAGGRIWVAAGRALWRIGEDGQARRIVALLPRITALAAASGDRVVFSEGNQLWALTEGQEGSATGSAPGPPPGFSRIPGSDGPETILAVAAAGRLTAWATGRGVYWSEGDGAPGSPLRLPAPAVDLRFCGAALLVLHERGLIAVGEDGQPRAVGPGLGARRLGCGDDGSWWLIGPRLLVSRDEGRSFRQWGGLPAGAVNDAAPGRRRLWLATPDGLYSVGPSGGSGGGAGSPRDQAGLSDEEPGVGGTAASGLSSAERPAAPVLEDRTLRVPSRTARRVPPGWVGLLPRLVVAASARIAIGGGQSREQIRDDVRALAYADFPLGSASGAPPPGRLPRTTAHLAEDRSSPASPAAVARDPDDPGRACLTAARAAAVARALAEPERARSFVARAGSAAWLPELRLRIDRRLGRSESLDLPSGGALATGPLGLDTANDVRYEGRLTWDLSKLVFNPDEIAAEAQALHMADMRREVESLMNRLHFERRRLLLESSLAPGAEAATVARRDLRAEELAADLDALSGGAYSRCAGADPGRPPSGWP